MSDKNYGYLGRGNTKEGKIKLAGWLLALLISAGVTITIFTVNPNPSGLELAICCGSFLAPGLLGEFLAKIIV